jgi:hypothetical protein
MITFNNFTSIKTITEAKNTHMTHIEDLVLDGGVDGTRSAINALRSLRDMLGGSSNTSHNVTVKWDGAPAVFAGIDPSDGVFFVAKKGIFNKNPKVYKSFDDIDADTSGELSVKLKIAYTEFKKLNIKGVLQGDIMYIKPDLKKETIDGQKYITFHPNTIVYAIPVDQATDVIASKIGVVWHTKYTGTSFESMSASFDISINSLKKSRSVWMRTADLQDLSGTATMTKSETETVTKNLSNAGKIFRKISSSTLKEVSDNSIINQMINTFNNTKVRSQEKITNTKSHTEDLISWINIRYQKEIDKLKTDKGKDRKRGVRDDVLSFFSDDNKANLKLMFDLQNHLVAAKEILIDQLDKVSDINTFVKTIDGFKTSGSEGFVAIDTDGSAVKLVDRMEFSSNNFSKDIIKGWQK